MALCYHTPIVALAAIDYLILFHSPSSGFLKLYIVGELDEGKIEGGKIDEHWDVVDQLGIT
jgi:predicted SnoaL-like aldol condensation-catalyzing enzyme